MTVAVERAHRWGKKNNEILQELSAYDEIPSEALSDLLACLYVEVDLWEEADRPRLADYVRMRIETIRETRRAYIYEKPLPQVQEMWQFIAPLLSTFLPK